MGISAVSLLVSFRTHRNEKAQAVAEKKTRLLIIALRASQNFGEASFELSQLKPTLEKCRQGFAESASELEVFQRQARQVYDRLTGIPSSADPAMVEALVPIITGLLLDSEKLLRHASGLSDECCAIPHDQDECDTETIQSEKPKIPQEESETLTAWARREMMP
ncbi:MAG: hypothetical protein DRJ65_19705 [Acidobacteria bacterium]|nr:MAG: hypothetical protein DRJ65_19705 [Acidobacteriota bacterium]